MNRVERQPHAYLDLASRRLKGMKIERLLNLGGRKQPFRMLEVGVGSGGIANYFGTHPTLRCEVDAVDTCDSRVIADHYRFQLVHDTRLPFGDRAFDVIVSNHVIEHVGDESAQLQHLIELRRVMARDGVGYLAVPNRWMLVEPHYGLIFLSWLPRSWRSPYLRMARKGRDYDCEPLNVKDLERLLTSSGFQYENLCVEALRAVFDIEHPEKMATRLLQRIPSRALESMRAVVPTLIYRIWN